MGDTNPDYTHYCKYCGARPIIPGPHHSPTCPRFSNQFQPHSEEGMKYECKHCGAVPFVAGPHHKKSCPRYVPYWPW